MKLWNGLQLSVKLVLCCCINRHQYHCLLCSILFAVIVVHWCFYSTLVHYGCLKSALWMNLIWFWIDTACNNYTGFHIFIKQFSWTHTHLQTKTSYAESCMWSVIILNSQTLITLEILHWKHTTGTVKPKRWMLHPLQISSLYTK